MRKAYLVVRQGAFADEFNELEYARNHAKLNAPAEIYPRRAVVNVLFGKSALLLAGAKPIERYEGKGGHRG
jgi:hypothetical protein